MPCQASRTDPRRAVTLRIDGHREPQAYRLHDLRHSAATLPLEQGGELVVIEKLLGHAHIGVTATVYAHVRLILQRDAIDLPGHALRDPAETPASPTTATNRPSPEPPSAKEAPSATRATFRTRWSGADRHPRFFAHWV
ncbi:tyrosine-type recombinase/integrase [Streptomyces sp. NBC_01511]|uniref:tyrosine-type recombinase/integrase n=1 Tax=Streptomyces sp. NBC_01511 TaxID=2903889 RepID=UPI00386BECB2